MVNRKKLTIFDSNIWIGYFDELDSNHKKAEKLMASLIASEQSIVISEYILLEIATVLKRKVGQERATEIISFLLQIDSVKILPSSQFFQATLEEFLALNEKHLSFVDVSLVVLSADFRIETFDTKLAKAIIARG